ncbi:MAG: tRNA lysidine(34) synthetase TilS [Clostridia bacterium]|nr:tRNA lysidine(34) synthetase TilS [Clostridia bacterium]
MICKVKNTIEKYGMFNGCRDVVVGLSGGADSCALLHILCSLKDEYSLNITAAHVNHGIRGEEAQRDELFSQDFCKKLGVEFRVLHCNVPALAKEKSLGEEECGREVRYEFFKSISPGALIATAHNLSDCCETLLFNIVRGSSVKGLCSIPPVRDNIIRPLIECTRQEIEDYCKENQIFYVTDSTNLNDDYSRNKIRLNVLPELKKINPSLEKAFQRLISAARDDEDYFDKLTDSIILSAKCPEGYAADKLKDLHPAVLNRVISKIIAENTGKAPERIHIESVVSILGGGKTQVCTALTVCCENGILSFGEAVKTPEWSREFILDEEIITPRGPVRFKIVNKNEEVKQQFVHKNVLDYESIVGSLALRSRKTGDEIKIAGRNGTKTVKKLLTEARIKDKKSVIILCDSLGPVWVEGFGCAHRCRITDKTTDILKIIY